MTLVLTAKGGFIGVDGIFLPYIRNNCIFAPKKYCLTNSSKLDTMKAKPFIKCVGGKGQLIEQLEAKLPADFDNWENVTYIEPFVGGGAKVYEKRIV